MSDHLEVSPPSGPASRFGANAWLVDDMYEQYRRDPASVSDSWKEFFQDYRPGGVNLSRPASPEPAASPASPAATADRAHDANRVGLMDPAASSARPGSGGGANGLAAGSSEDPPSPLRGAALRVAANMTASLGVPTATSFRVVPARLLEVNRRMLNNQLSRTGS